MMTALGHERPKGHVCVESGLPPTSDIRRRGWHGRFVPQAAVSTRSKAALIDHLVGPCEHVRGQFEPSTLAVLVAVSGAGQGLPQQCIDEGNFG